MFTATRTRHDQYVIEPDDSGNFTAEMDGEQIELLLVADINDMAEHLTNRELREMDFGDHVFTVNLQIVPTADSTKPAAKDKLASTYGANRDEFTPEMTVGYGSGIPIDPESITDEESPAADDLDIESTGKQVSFTSWEDAEKYVENHIPGKAPAIAGLVGFYLDRPINRIGETGWDRLRELAVNPDSRSLDAAIDRHAAD